MVDTMISRFKKYPSGWSRRSGREKSNVLFGFQPDDQSFDEVQEEWLNEEVLTDDDFNAHDNDSTDQNESFNMELGLVPDDAPLTANRPMRNGKRDLSENIDTIDEYLDQFMDEDKETLADSWQTAKEAGKNATSTVDVNNIHNSDDSTDELLRVLGEDEKTLKPNLALAKSEKSTVEIKEEVSSEDEIFEGAKIRTVKLSKNVLMNKSVSEVKRETSDSEFSDDKANLRRIFRPTKKLQKAAKSTTKSALSLKVDTIPAKVYSSTTKAVPTVRKRGGGRTASQKPATRTATNLTKPEPDLVKVKAKFEPMVPKLEPVVQKLETYQNVVINDEKSLKMLLEKTKKEEESWDDENIEYLEGEFDEETSEDEDFERFNRSDDAMPMERDSDESEYSFYDGIATSESDDIQECFELDVRAERAADYVPMLGTAAFKLLMEEKGRVILKLMELRKVLAQLNEGVREQTAELEAARKKLRELNLQLNHT
ncbi:hypothetical protein EVAR_40763_1 [Eumeta japonica]|uniref:Uncharacterized protein n=1 Tax=Eumeta variegata TaxID=151549 RepID=A0A4C1X7L2_EUMVA|nr:hypothetical protein EVAR_40763_1 [Eumeta japonica]